MSIGGTPGGVLVTIYVGPLAAPALDKAERDAAPGDTVIALDSILASLTDAARPSAFTRSIAQRAFTAAMTQSLRLRAETHVRIVHPVPTVKQLQTWARLRYFIETIDQGRAHAEDTAPDRDALQEARRWYDRYPEGAASIQRVIAHRATTSQPAELPAAELQPSRAW